MASSLSLSFFNTYMYIYQTQGSRQLYIYICVCLCIVLSVVLCRKIMSIAVGKKKRRKEICSMGGDEWYAIQPLPVDNGTMITIVKNSYIYLSFGMTILMPFGLIKRLRSDWLSFLDIFGMGSRKFSKKILRWLEENKWKTDRIVYTDSWILII